MEVIFQSDEITVLRIDNETEYSINPEAKRPGKMTETIEHYYIPQSPVYYHGRLMPIDLDNCIQGERVVRTGNSNVLSHIPIFPHKKLFIDLGGTLRWFIPIKSVHGFSYRKGDGEMSVPYTATYCEMEGVEAGTVVILGEYSQSPDCDWLDNASPYADLRPCRMNLWTEAPRVFYNDETKTSHFIPKLVEVYYYKEYIYK